jgi:hypothetical protein
MSPSISEAEAEQIISSKGLTEEGEREMVSTTGVELSTVIVLEAESVAPFESIALARHSTASDGETRALSS